MIFFNFIHQISIEFRIRNTLFQKLLQIDMVFFNQFIVSTVKFGKCFAEFMILIALLKEFGSKEFVATIEVTNMRRRSCKANK